MMTPAEREILYTQPLFAEMPRAEVDALAGTPGCATADFERGDVIYGHENFLRALAVLLSGSALVTRDTADGGSLVMSRLYPGSIFGAAAIFGGGERYASVITALERTRAVFIPEAVFREAMRDNPRLAENYIRYLTERIAFLNRRIYCLAAGTAEQKLASFLLGFLREGVPEKLPVSMTDMAKLLNMGRASLYRAMEGLVRVGAVSRTGNNITIINKKILSEV